MRGYRVKCPECGREQEADGFCPECGYVLVEGGDEAVTDDNAG